MGEVYKQPRWICHEQCSGVALHHQPLGHLLGGGGQGGLQGLSLPLLIEGLQLHVTCRHSNERHTKSLKPHSTHFNQSPNQSK